MRNQLNGGHMGTWINTRASDEVNGEEHLAIGEERLQVRPADFALSTAFSISAWVD